MNTLESVALKNDMPGGNYSSGGIFNPRNTEFGLYNFETTPEGTTFRWTAPQATFTFPYAAHLGRHARIVIRMAGNRPAGEEPARVTVLLNGEAHPQLTVGNTFDVYTFELDAHRTPNPYLDPAHIQLDVQSTTFSPPNDGRELGVAVDWIELTPQRSRTEIAAEVGVWMLGLLAVALIALVRRGIGWSVAYGLGALVTLAASHLSYQPRPFPLVVVESLAVLAWVLAAWLAPRRRPVWGFALALLGLWVVVAGQVLPDWQTDDAYISYRYAWNLVQGHGLVYNPGEVVEGYTNFLWTLLGAAAIGLGMHPAGVTLAATVALSIALVALTYHLGAKLTGWNYFWGSLAAGLLAVDVSFITWGARGSGIEAAPFALLVLLAVGVLWGGASARGETGSGKRETGNGVAWLWGGHGWRSVMAGIVLGLGTLMRPEGLLVAALVIGAKAWELRITNYQLRIADGERRGRGLLYLVLPFLLIVVPYQVWRIGFYGFLFPNTFYAKTGLSQAVVMRGWEYTWQFVVAHWLVVALALAGVVFKLVGWWGEKRETRRKRLAGGGVIYWALLVLVAVYAAYIVVAGGDHFPAWRFFVPLLAPIVLLATEGARAGLALLASVRWLRGGAAGALAVALVLYGATSIQLQDPQGPLARITNRNTNFVNIWGSAGIWLRENTPPETWAASPVAGAIAYYSERRVVDMHGLNDLHIGHLDVETIGTGLAGHEKRDPAYVLSRQPDYILPYPDYFTPVEEQFDREYVTTTVRGPLGEEFEWWVRRDAARR